VEARLLFNLDPYTIFLATIAFIIALAVHEANHAFVATALGDDTPRRHGRLTLNPLKHVDPMGIVFFVLAGFGWASTPVTPANLKPNPRTGNAIVALAGPVANISLAILLSIPLWLGLQLPPTVHRLIVIGISLNVLLFVFNLLPIPPLDGFTVLLGIVPSDLAYRLQGLERYGMAILLLVLVLPSLMGWSIPGCGSPISCLVQPVARALRLPIPV
jgi:Zn-dependent protease